MCAQKLQSEEMKMIIRIFCLVHFCGTMERKKKHYKDTKDLLICFLYDRFKLTCFSLRSM